RPKLIRDLLQSSPQRDTQDNSASDRIAVRIEPADTLNKVAVSCERQYFTHLYLREEGDFAAISNILLGDPGQARKVQLRFNQLGLRVRELKSRLS
ncbi:MAG: hypothetical protein GWP91_17970, partial [Rhodobacterales bacterium]|nr:hypothetical protein [Rhodobacterales bacterium]